MGSECAFSPRKGLMSLEEWHQKEIFSCRQRASRFFMRIRQLGKALLWMRYESGSLRGTCPGGDTILFLDYSKGGSVIKQEETYCFSEAHYRLAMEAGGVGMWRWDLQGQRQDWNTQCKALFGLLPEEEVDYHRFLSLIHPDDREW